MENPYYDGKLVPHNPDAVKKSSEYTFQLSNLYQLNRISVTIIVSTLTEAESVLSMINKALK
jgi:hypothetical protein